MFGDCVLTPTADKRSQALSSLYILYGIRCGIYHGIRNICVNCTLVDLKYLACKYHFVNEIQNDSLIGCFFELHFFVFFFFPSFFFKLRCTIIVLHILKKEIHS